MQPLSLSSFYVHQKVWLSVCSYTPNSTTVFGGKKPLKSDMS